MEKAFAACSEFKEKYDKCWAETKKGLYEGMLDNNCADPFEDYSLCVSEVMKGKVEKERQTREQAK
jgi:hypothetical protein